MTPKDLFSAHSKDYSKYRPRYPEELFDYLATLCNSRQTAWDCGTGNGQAAESLARLFDRVIATDLSPNQLAAANNELTNVEYRVARAESSGIPDRTVDLVTVAQAFHWFDHERFFDEVRRVIRPGGKLAIWCYALCKISPEVDAVIQDFYDSILGPYWEPERRSVDQGYRDIRVPFEDLQAPAFEIKADWSADQLIGYLRTWSALRSYVGKNGMAEIDPVFKSIEKAWGTNPIREIRWPLSLRIFVVDSAHR